ncbi:hypothetical protein BDR04DRAFT_810202 [Suillus decipiens]|nr:hypothetical protein BDR04DRAFT_810202 [Suillus decipiens]
MCVSDTALMRQYFYVIMMYPPYSIVTELLVAMSCMLPLSLHYNVCFTSCGITASSGIRQGQIIVSSFHLKSIVTLSVAK